jgi:hypothetical protein
MLCFFEITYIAANKASYIPLAKIPFIGIFILENGISFLASQSEELGV